MNTEETITRNHLTFSKRKLPMLGALMDYIESTYLYVRGSSAAERFHLGPAKAKLSATFLTGVCLALGLACNIKFEMVTVDDEPLARDLHFMLMSRDEKLYIDDIDLTRVMWCIEASDCMAIIISCLLVWSSSNMPSPLSEHAFAPWAGAAARGLALRQAPTAAAALYTAAIVGGRVDACFAFAYVALLMIEVRLGLEVARLVWSRWARRGLGDVLEIKNGTRSGSFEKNPENRSEDNTNTTHSVELGNYVY